MAKLVKYIFIPICFVFLMSHNASALTTTFDMTQYTPVVRQVYNLVDCTFRQETNPVQTVYKNSVSNCSLDQISLKVKLTKIVTSNSITFKKADIVEFDVINYLGNYDNTSSYNTIDFSWNAFKLNDVTNFYMMGYDEVFYNTNSNGTQFGNVNAALRFRVYVNNDIYTPIGLYATDVTYNPIATWRQSTNGLKWNIINLTVYRKTGKTSVNQEQEEATQNAADDSQTSGNSSQSSAEGATQSLLTTINSGIGVITSARATNCQINGNMGNLDLGNLDLCANTVPTFVQIILSLVAVVTVIPLAIVLFNRFIGIFRSFQG